MMRPGFKRRAVAVCRVLAAAGLGLLPLRPAAPWAPAAAQGGRPCEPRTLALRAPDGDVIHAITYRPAGAPSQGAVLALSGPRGAPSDSLADAACWGALAAELCQNGWQVVRPDVGERHLPGGAAIGPELSPAMRAALMAAPEAAAAVAGAFSDSVAMLAVICAGPAGRWAPRLAQSDPRVTTIVWILPEGDEGLVDRWELPADRPMRLLLIASEARAQSLALASDLFSRFNRCSELWLLDWGPSGCALLTSARQRRALCDWLAAGSQAAVAGAAHGSRHR